MEDRAASTARRMWTLFEPIHAVAYFAPEALAVYEDAGLRGFWRGYFACRAAPLGPVGPEPVAAAFFSFAPAMVARALPDVWQLTAPERALEIRRAGAVAALRRLLAGHEPEAERAAEALVPRAAGLDTAGRVLAAAHASLDFPDQPLDRLWHAATLLREHRGDGHVAALVAAGLDGCEALALRAGTDIPRGELQPYRGWTDQEWEAARLHLTERGLLLPDGTASRNGRELLRAVESATDRAAERPWRALAPDAVQDLTARLTPVSRACAAALRFPNPIGLPEPNSR
ncbi:conserved hypothetical alanine-rich protein [Streptomyces himastatinicus ATCC 53653]|uniref:Conserved hypothetical alanine-rich protein n=1 Tax=Streptomyces himastatinicus ATCC 53653 TaxID=457427 RepID=D9W6A8_9ACTN|nr:hypothetical protein [Streptomyces himastatinicus]EFL22439.1 conserved hypothetical alanine-rich protein [Streptomyces himastatinicus ATCC 53653]